MKTKNQKGFSLVEGFLILVIVGILGGVGWYVWKSSEDSKKSLDSASQADIKATNKAGISTQDWQTYNGDGFSLKYPKDWSVTIRVQNKCPTNDYFGIAVKCPAQFTVSPAIFPNNLVEQGHPFNGVIYTGASESLDLIYARYQQDFQKVEKSEKLKINNLDGFLVRQHNPSVEAGEYRVEYYIFKISDGVYLHTSYIQQDDPVDNSEYSEIIDKIIDSIQKD